MVDLDRWQSHAQRFGAKGNLPSGALLGSEPIAEVIWEGRNHAMHWEEGRKGTPAHSMLLTLQADGLASVLPNENNSLAILDSLGWTSADGNSDYLARAHLAYHYLHDCWAVRIGGLIWAVRCSVDTDEERRTYESEARVQRLLHRRRIVNERVPRSGTTGPGGRVLCVGTSRRFSTSNRRQPMRR